MSSGNEYFHLYLAYTWRLLFSLPTYICLPALCVPPFSSISHLPYSYYHLSQCSGPRYILQQGKALGCTREIEISSREEYSFPKRNNFLIQKDVCNSAYRRSETRNYPIKMMGQQETAAGNNCKRLG